METSAAVGIDIGTKSSAVSYLKKNIFIISNDNQSNYLPSVVYIGDDYIKVGNTFDFKYLKPERFIFGFKRLIGQFSDSSNIKRFEQSLGNDHYKIVFNEKKQPYISIVIDNKERLIEPEVINYFIVKEIKKNASNFLETPVTDAVITVPCCFNTKQRQSLVDSTRLAGLNVLQLLNESTATAISYAYESISGSTQENLLVFNLGEYYLDVSVIAVKENQFQVLASKGGENLGGEKFDNILTTFFVKKLQKTFKDVLIDTQIMSEISNQAKKARIILTKSEKATISLGGILKDKNVELSVKRKYFEDGCAIPLKLIMDQIEEVFKSSKLLKSDLNRIVLAGGCSRMPKIQQLLMEAFPNQKLCKDINPEEAASMGAGILARILRKSRYSFEFSNFKLQETLPFIYFMKGPDNTVIWETQENTKLPYKKSFESRISFKNNQKFYFVVKSNYEEILMSFNPINHLRKSDSQHEGKINIEITIDTSGITNIQISGTDNDIKNNKAECLKLTFNFNKSYSIEENSQNADLKNYII